MTLQKLKRWIAITANNKKPTTAPLASKELHYIAEVGICTIQMLCAIIAHINKVHHRVAPKKTYQKLNTTKKILIAVLVTNLLCTFLGGHGGAPLGLVELITLYSVITFNFSEFPFFSFWTLAAAFMLAGQVIVLIGLWKTNLLDTIRFGKFGTILLILPLIVIAVEMGGHLWTATLITSLPFLVLTIAFWWTTVRLHKRNS
ncbi:MAG TPA: hypothetical protein VLC98_17540 [Phnomibacter sp.]|nr:hypothetical protein [Phnomibacter sp.]